MDFLTQNRGVRWLIIGLVVLNLLLLASFWYSKLGTSDKKIKAGGDSQRRGEVRGPDLQRQREMGERQDKRTEAFLKSELGFSQQQVDEFIKIRKEHRAAAEQLRHRMDELRRSMMDQLLEERPDYELVDRLSMQMGQTLTELEKSTFYHLDKLMSIGDEEQRRKTRSMMRQIMEQLRPPDHRGRPGGPGPPGERDPEHMDRPHPPPHRYGERPPHPPPDRRREGERKRKRQ